MPTYHYKVRDKTGNLLEGEMEAQDAKILRLKLDEKNFFLIEYTEEKPKTGGIRWLSLSRQAVKLTDISLFSWQLYTMIDAGMPLIDSLNIIERQTKNERFRSAIQDIGRRIAEGSSFSEALQAHPNVFSRLYTQMINAGEVGGVLDEMVRRLAVYYEWQAEIQSKIRSALTYPLLLVVISFCVVVFLVTYVLPKFVMIFDDIGATIPVPTRMLLNISFAAAQYWYVWLSIIGGVCALYIVYVKTPAGRYMVDRFKISIPLLGSVIKKTLITRFAQTFSILLGSGIPVLVALDVVSETIGNRVLVETLDTVADRVKDGKSIAGPLEGSRVFPEMVVNMIRVGEETGELDKMLVKISDFYTREVDEVIQSSTKLIEPFLIVFMAFVIGFIAISIFLPLTDIMQQLHH